MNLSEKQTEAIKKHWFAARGHIVLTDGLSVSFRMYSELHGTVELTLEALSVESGVEVVGCLYAQSDIAAIRQIEAL